jgi:plastocyanin
VTNRSAAMTVYAVAYWALVLAVLDVIVVAFLPVLRVNPAEILPILVLVGGFVVVFGVCALVATRLSSASRRPWLWPALAIPAVVFLLLNGQYLVYPLIHPAESTFAATLVMVVATIVLVVSGALAFRDARDPANRSGSRTRLGASIVAAVTAGAVVTGVVAGAVGGGASQLAASPTTTATLVAQNTKYAPTTYTMSSSDVLGLFVENRDSTAHSFDVDALNIHVQVPANSTVAVAIKPTGSGPLEFYCAIGGHKAAGMDGTISVS